MPIFTVSAPVVPTEMQTSGFLPYIDFDLLPVNSKKMLLFCIANVLRIFLFTFVHLYFAQQNVQAPSALAYRKDFFFPICQRSLSRKLNLPILLESVQSESKVS